MGGELDRWMTRGDAPEADWSAVVLRRAMRGELGDGGPGLLLDLVALGQPYACVPGRCTPGRRASAARSCCADLDVTVSEAEVARIEAAADDVTRVMGWAALPEWRDGDVLRRPRRRCVFAEDGPEGLRCGLQRTERATRRPSGALKPLPCRLFPLALVDLGDGTRLLTAIHRSTARHLASRPARVFPCLAADQPPLYVSERATIEQVFGKAVWRRIERALAAE